MLSKMITDRQKAAADLSGTVETFAAQASDVFLEMIEPDLEEGALPPDMVHLQTLLSRRLDRLRKKLIELDEVHNAERKEDRDSRGQRDTAALELKDLLLRLRGVVDNSCGAGSCARFLGVEGPMPRDPVAILRVANRLVDGLSEGFLEGADTLLAGIELNTAAWVDQLREPMGRLEDALVRLSRENPETVNHLVTKNSAIGEYDRTYRATASIVESLCRYVGRADLAERIRPKQRSPAGESAVADVREEVDEPPSEGIGEIFPEQANDGVAPV